MKNLSTSQRSRLAPGPMPETVRGPAALNCMFTVYIEPLLRSFKFIKAQLPLSL